MDDEQDSPMINGTSGFHVPNGAPDLCFTNEIPDSALNTDPMFANMVPNLRAPASFYFMQNSGVLPHVSIGCNGDKRKKVLVTMEEKLRALQRLDAGDPVRVIAEELGVGKSTVSDWKKHRIEIERWYANQAGASCIKARKTMRKGKHAQVEKALYHWFEYVRSRGFQVSGPLLQQKALQFKDKIEGEEGEKFTASEGWLDRWKKRFGIGNLLSTKVNQNEDENCVEEFKKDLYELGNIDGEQLYCCGRTVLNYRTLPNRILGSSEDEIVDCKINEESVMVLACSNASGNHKLRLTFIGKSEKFQTLESIKDNELLPFWYSQQTEVWLDGEVLKSWFDSEFVPAVEKNLTLNELPRKALLLVTNYPSFTNFNEFHNGDIRAVFLPLNAASICQPMDRGILESLKKKYWCKLLCSVISTSTDGESCLKTLKHVDIIEAIQFLSEAWEEIPSLNFVRSWKHLIDQLKVNDWEEFENQVSCDMANDDKELVTLLKKIVGSDDVSLQDVNDWIASEEEDEIICEDIIAMVSKEPQIDLDPSEENSINDGESIEIKAELPALHGDSSAENLHPHIKRVRHSEGFKAIMKVLEYVSQQEETSQEDITCLLKWRDIAASKGLQEEKQKKAVKRPKLL